MAESLDHSVCRFAYRLNERRLPEGHRQAILSLLRTAGVMDEALMAGFDTTWKKSGGKPSLLIVSVYQKRRMRLAQRLAGGARPPRQRW